jgi:hypothetical protein
LVYQKDDDTYTWSDVSFSDANTEEEDGTVTVGTTSFDVRLNGGLHRYDDWFGPSASQGEVMFVSELGKKNQAVNAYARTNDRWVGFWQKDGGSDLNTRYKNLMPFKTGGLADFTGPAWLDGTPSKPEYILNAKQTERFFSLIDVLEGIDTKESKNTKTGDSYFDININVDKLESDYDVEKVADKIRRMIYEDASYRNVNAINLIR